MPDCVAVRLGLPTSVTVMVWLGGVTSVTEKLWDPASPPVNV